MTEAVGKMRSLIVEYLRDKHAPLTYDRIGYGAGFTHQRIRSVTSMCRSLVDSGHLEVTGPSLTLLGRSAKAYRTSESYRSSRYLVKQRSLFAETSFTRTTKQAITDFILTIGRGQAERSEVSFDIVDTMTAATMPDDRYLDDGDQDTLTLRESHSTQTSPDQRILRSRKSQIVYAAIVNGEVENLHGLTRDQLRRKTGLWASTLIPRVADLIAAGLCREGTKYTDSISKRSLTPIVHVPLARTVRVKTTPFYQDRIKIAKAVEGYLRTNVGDIDRVYETALRMCCDFVNTYSKPTEKMNER